MTSWADLKSHIHAKYKVQNDAGEGVVMIFDTAQGRSQVVVVRSLGNTGWACVMTKVADEHQVDLRDLLVRNNNMTVGSFALAPDGSVMLTHSFPLENLDANEFEEPLERIVTNGDRIELELTGDDRF